MSKALANSKLKLTSTILDDLIIPLSTARIFKSFFPSCFQKTGHRRRPGSLCFDCLILVSALPPMVFYGHKDTMKPSLEKRTPNHNGSYVWVDLVFWRELVTFFASLPFPFLVTSYYRDMMLVKQDVGGNRIWFEFGTYKSWHESLNKFPDSSHLSFLMNHFTCILSACFSTSLHFLFNWYLLPYLNFAFL